MPLAPEQWDKVKDVVAAALELPSEQRDSYVRSECNSDERILEEALSLLSFTPAATLAPPKWIKNRYRIESELGCGGFAIAYLALDSQLHDRPVVVKILSNAQRDPYLQRKFEEEIFALSRLVHPNIVIPLDSGRTAEGQSFLVMQFVNGRTLREFIKGGLLDRRTVAEITKQLGDALAFAHANGIVHRDVKPENVLIQTADDGTAHAWLIDFGISRVLEQQRDDLQTHIVGTASYMAPEQFQGEVSAKCDVYAFGAVVYEMLTGEAPFGKGNPCQIMDRQKNGRLQPLPSQLGLSSRVFTLIEETLAFDPVRRPVGIGQVGAQLAASIRGETKAKTSNFKVMAVAAIAVAATFLVVGALFYLVHPVQPPSVVVTKYAPETPPPLQPKPEIPRTLGSVALELAGDPGGAVTPNSSGVVNMRRYDHFRLRVTALADAYLYMFARSVETSDLHVLFPSPTANGSKSFLAAGQPQTIPSKKSFSFEGEKGAETLILVFSVTPDPLLEEARKYANSRDKGAVPAGPISAKLLELLAGPNAARPAPDAVHFLGDSRACGWITINHNI